MNDWKRSLSLQYIASEFEDVDENVFEDLSEIHFMAVMDFHDEGYEIEVLVFGRKLSSGACTSSRIMWNHG